MTSLPAQFSDLEPYVAKWCYATDKERAVARIGTNIGPLRAFHAAVAPRMEAMIAYFNTFPNDPQSLPPDTKRLYQLAQMVMEASPPIDLEWESADIEDVFPMERIEFVPLSG